MLIVLLIILLVFGGSKLPQLARSLGQAQKEFTSDPARRKMLQQAELLDRLQRSTGRLVVVRARAMASKYPEGEGLPNR